MILQLARNPDNLEELSQNERLLGALSRYDSIVAVAVLMILIIIIIVVFNFDCNNKTD
jgi:hypothetical protein